MAGDLKAGTYTRKCQYIATRTVLDTYICMYMRKHWFVHYTEIAISEHVGNATQLAASAVY